MALLALAILTPVSFSKPLHGQPAQPTSEQSRYGSATSSFNHLIGTDHDRWRDGDAERLGVLEVDG
jgi:hypothetical protein